MKTSLILFTFFLFLNTHAKGSGAIHEMNQNLNLDISSTQEATNNTVSAPNKDCDEDEANELDQVGFDDISVNISRKLITKRTTSDFMKTCFKQMGQDIPNSFQEAIRFAVKAHLADEKGAEFSVLSSYDAGNIKKAVSLISSPMCTETDAYFISSSSSAKQKVSTMFKDKQNNFAKAFNKLRADYLKAVADKKDQTTINQRLERIEKFYYSFLATLAQHESLSTANGKSSKANATKTTDKYNVGNYTKPDGVKFYYDKKQSNEHSKYNMGLYQFSSNKGGNTKPCVQSWNKAFAKKYPKCKINTPAHADLFKFLAAPDQIFNAFCGASKLVQSKTVQINTDQFERYKSRRRRTHIANTIVDKKTKARKLKAPKDRCFSPFSYTLHTYNHYGTLGHTVFLDENGKTVERSDIRYDKDGNITNVKATNTTKVIDHMLDAMAPAKK
jgi:hypothetical protein